MIRTIVVAGYDISLIPNGEKRDAIFCMLITFQIGYCLLSVALLIFHLTDKDLSQPRFNLLHVRQNGTLLLHVLAPRHLLRLLILALQRIQALYVTVDIANGGQAFVTCGVAESCLPSRWFMRHSVTKCDELAMSRMPSLAEVDEIIEKISACELA